MDNQEHDNNIGSNLSVKRERILQPSVSSVEAIQAAQAEANQATTPAPRTVPDQTLSTPQPLSQTPHPTLSSIYPEATKGVGIPPPLAPTPVTPSTEPSPVDRNIMTRIILIRLVAGAILLINAVNAYNWFIERGGGYTSWINIIEIIVMLVLAVRIFKLSEAARAGYVLIAEILVVLTLAGFLLFYARNHNNPVLTHGISSLTKSQLQQGIIGDEHNPYLSPKQKQQLISILQNQLNKETGSTVDIKAKQYLSDVLLLVTTLGPIIFFTRPSIKSVFKA
jgi:hypothetical protein